MIAPGPISGTEGARRLVETGKGSDRRRKIPVGRLGSLKDMGDAVVYLFSDAGSFVNGAVLVGKLTLYFNCSWSRELTLPRYSRWRSVANRERPGGRRF